MPPRGGAPLLSCGAGEGPPVPPADFRKSKNRIDNRAKMMYDNKTSLPGTARMRPARGKAALVGELAVPCTCNPLQQG